MKIKNEQLPLTSEEAQKTIETFVKLSTVSADLLSRIKSAEEHIAVCNRELELVRQEFKKIEPDVQRAIAMLRKS